MRELEEKLRDARPADRTRDWVLQQETADATTHTGQNPEHKHTDPILSRLQLIAARINSLTSETPGRCDTSTICCSKLGLVMSQKY